MAFILFFFLLFGTTVANAQLHVSGKLHAPEGKEIYIPEELRGNDFTCDTSRLSYARMACNDDFVVFWEKGFGHDLNNPPHLEGQPMAVDVQRLMSKVDRFYRFYTDTLKFVLPGSKAEKYRMMAILNYSLEGTAYGGDYDGQIGALWIAPNRLQDPKLNCIAHELGHSFQSQVVCDGAGEAWGGGGIFEMTSQWMLWQVNPEWVFDEAYHWEAWQGLTHKPFLDGENIYHSPYVLEWWSVKRGLTVMADMFRAGRKGEDPVDTYKRLYSLSQAQFCDEMFDGYRHLLTYDWDRVREVCRPLSGRWQTKVTAAGKPVDVDERHPLRSGLYSIAAETAPGDCGFNAIALCVPKAGGKVTVDFKSDKAAHRYGFVAVRYDGTAIYSDAASENGRLEFTAPSGSPLWRLFLVVMGAPQKHVQHSEETYPYSFKLNVEEQEALRLASPDGRTTVSVLPGDTVALAVVRDGVTMLAPSKVCLVMDGGRSIGTGDILTVKCKSRMKTGVKESIDAPFYRQSHFDVEYNELTISTRYGGIAVRAYDEGVAYRFFTDIKKEHKVLEECADYRFAGNPDTWLSYTTNTKKPLAMAFQNTYTVKPLCGQDTSLPTFLPATIGAEGEYKLTILESNLEAYPGMFLQPCNGGLKAVFAPYPKATAFYPWRQQEYVTETEDYIASVEGPRSFPWRVLAITERDIQMPVNNLVYALAAPNRIGDTGWIRPGKVAWDWWNDWGLEGVDFKAGINTRTYKHYIDFAARHGLEYVVLDEGWYNPKSGDMLTVVPDIDLDELVRYGKDKGVDIVLWTVFNVLDRQLAEACSKYAAMGIKGFKVDFLDRDDQTALEMIFRIAKACAEHHLLLDYHGIFKPSGLNRTYPNIINYEACFGMEETKWEPVDKDMPQYDVTMPFIRGMAGYVDFTPGAMRNANKADWHPVYSHPMSQGTRCHQAAMYVCYDSPFTMLADSPSEYAKDESYTSFIASLPTEFVETRILAGHVGEYIVVARKDKHGNVYVAGMNNWHGERAVHYDLAGMLDEGAEYHVQTIADGINADKTATDYQYKESTAKGAAESMKCTTSLANGGGFVTVYRKK